jgi:CofD-related protein of GAK system
MTSRIRLTRTVTLPDPLKLARFARAPELGPRILFFSGGTALARTSRALTRYTHQSIHLITTFDSGGSSAKLRQAFRMPAVGDIRNRLMALADDTVTGNPAVVRLFAHRLPYDPPQGELRDCLDHLVLGRDPLIQAVPDPLRKIIRSHLGFFREAMPPDFDLKGASLGNLVLAGGYLNHGRHLDPVVYLFGKLVEARGLVRPILNQHLHLAAELDDGRMVVGQHRMTGREVPPLSSPIRRLFLAADDQKPEPVRPPIRKKTKALIGSADLIVYPMGSFYTSVVANLLPDGVARAAAEADCPKVFVPNTAPDPESAHLGIDNAARTLMQYLNPFNHASPSGRLLDFVLIDSTHGGYPRPVDDSALAGLGVRVIDTELVTPASRPLIDPERLADVLLSLT